MENDALKDSIREDRIDVVEELIAQGADLSSHSNPPLYIALLLNRGLIAQKLVAAGASVIPDCSMHPLAAACSSHARGLDLDVVRSILDAGAAEFINKPYDHTYGNTVLHYAAWKRLPELISLLMAYGADPCKKNRNGEDVVAYVRKDLHPTDRALVETKIMPLLMPRYIKPDKRDERVVDLIEDAIHYNNSKKIREFIAKGSLHQMQKLYSLVSLAIDSCDDANLFKAY